MNNPTWDNFVAFVKQHAKVLIAIGIALALVLVVYTKWSSTWSTGVRYETQLSAQYLDNQNYLSAYISGFYEQTGVVKAASASIDTIITDAVKGRYDAGQNGGGFGTGSPLFAAIAEQYPDLTGLTNNWGKVQDYITAGRESYRNIQSKLLDQLRGYDTWRNSGVIDRFFISLVGIPSSNLKARIGEVSITGTDALNKMYQIVLTKDALDAYGSGTLAPLQP